MSKVMLDRAIAKSKKAKEPAVTFPKAAPAKQSTLSDEELQSYIDILLEASKPDPLDRLQQAMITSGDLTKKILLEKYGIHAV